jgi:hypothetical protein
MCWFMVAIDGRWCVGNNSGCLCALLQWGRALRQNWYRPFEFSILFGGDGLISNVRVESYQKGFGLANIVTQRAGMKSGMKYVSGGWKFMLCT